MKDRLIEFGFSAAWQLVRIMPASFGAFLFRAAADRLVARQNTGVQRLATNLSVVLGEPAPPALVREAMHSYARYWFEAFRLPALSQAQLRDGFRLEGLKKLIAAHEEGTGAVLALGHVGNWDAAGALLTSNGLPLTTVAERLRPESLYRKFVAYREKLGMNIVPLTGGAPPMDELVRAIGQAHIVPLLSDRDLSRRGVAVDFFGARTKLPAGPALLTIRTGAPLFVVNMWYEPDMPCGQVVGPLTVPGPDVGPLDVRVALLTQWIADELARGIAAHPQDWHMLQKMWLEE